jgi:hypothetical protein
MANLPEQLEYARANMGAWGLDLPNADQEAVSRGAHYPYVLSEDRYGGDQSRIYHFKRGDSCLFDTVVSDTNDILK